MLAWHVCSVCLLLDQLPLPLYRGQQPVPLVFAHVSLMNRNGAYCGHTNCCSTCERSVVSDSASQTSHRCKNKISIPLMTSYHTCCKRWFVVLQVQDFATVVFRMKALGFNTIKLPFSFETLNAGWKRPFYDGCNLASTDTLKKGLTEGGKGGILFPFCRCMSILLLFLYASLTSNVS